MKSAENATQQVTQVSVALPREFRPPDKVELPDGRKVAVPAVYRPQVQVSWNNTRQLSRNSQFIYHFKIRELIKPQVTHVTDTPNQVITF